MSAVMGVMIVLMVIGLGFGHHRMMGGHGEKEKNEAVMQHDEKIKPCLNCPVSEKNEDSKSAPAEKTLEEGK